MIEERSAEAENTEENDRERKCFCMGMIEELVKHYEGPKNEQSYQNFYLITRDIVKLVKMKW